MVTKSGSRHTGYDTKLKSGDSPVADRDRRRVVAVTKTNKVATYPRTRLWFIVTMTAARKDMQQHPATVRSLAIMSFRFVQLRLLVGRTRSPGELRLLRLRSWSGLRQRIFFRAGRYDSGRSGKGIYRIANVHWRKSDRHFSRFTFRFAWRPRPLFAFRSGRAVGWLGFQRQLSRPWFFPPSIYRKAFHKEHHRHLYLNAINHIVLNRA